MRIDIAARFHEPPVIKIALTIVGTKSRKVEDRRGDGGGEGKMDRKRWKGEELMNEVGAGYGEKGRAKKNGRECEKKAGGKHRNSENVNFYFDFESNIFPNLCLLSVNSKCINRANSFTLDGRELSYVRWQKLLSRNLQLKISLLNTVYTWCNHPKQFIL